MAETENLETLSNLKPESAKNGVGLGIIVLILSIVSSYALLEATSMMLVFIIPMVIGMLIPLVFAVFFCFDLRKKIGGYWNFRQATSGIFIMFLVSYIISVAGGLVFNKLIDKDMPVKIQRTVVNATTSMMEKQGLDEDVIEKKVHEMNAELEKKNNGTVMQTINGYVIGIIIIFVASLLFGAMFKKSAPKYVIEE